MFTVIEDAWAVLISRGVYRQVKVYERKGAVFVAHGSGYIATYSNGRTGLPNIRWDELHVDFKIETDSIGRVKRACIEE